MIQTKIKNFLSNTRNLLIIALLIIAPLYLRQCSKTNEEEEKRKTAERIAEQNFKAMNDSTIQLKLTREQLAFTDKKLSQTVKEADSVIRALGHKKDKVREVIRVQPVIVEKNSEVTNNVRKDSTDSTKYNLDFKISDSIKSFNGVSSFLVKKTDSGFSISPDSTKIKDFKLNFDMVVVKYEDYKDKVTKYKILPHYIDSAGNTHLLSENQIKFNIRGVELLDKPFQENKPGPKTKTRLVGAWGLGLNPIGLGPVVRNSVLKLGYTPSISFGYFLTFRKK